ncbi:MAG: GNAT family N-acetyltransferase [Alphaproteobacteria bacterium 16-39-46]|nr:MAG: GNAT family N-acetyltransferase [Alphaproteobacteria bacterium 16-39-46]OZA43760.1 MAG: GNAT family N-acetyltransferase [Alphaproteobacteria bacterium 17-39-52]HQS83576.1 helix-turn-helix domain-containing GNAT family N-acetyltransferase [Alphaproteobacteria bacterium]HQS93325.1 helix-turn-helix domain-containing GNAT family N-acetyltransferase [Alphaproteobacteria bacterium]
MKNNIDLLRQLSRKLIRELGILDLNTLTSQESPAHWHALIEISKEHGITISKLGHLLLLSLSTVSRLVTTLQKSELLILERGKDKREKYLSLTEKGHLQIQKIDAFSNSKIRGAFEFLNETDQNDIIRSITTYGNALEKSRKLRDDIKIGALSTSRTLRKQIVTMIEEIQKNEFSIPISDDTNLCVLRAEEDFYYYQTSNFWYAANSTGKILGSIGLKKIDAHYGEIKKFFVVKDYRGKGVAQKLMETLLKSAVKHHFEFLVLGTVDKLHAAQKFYTKQGFLRIDPKDLPKKFEKCPVDTVFFKASLQELKHKTH